MKLILLSAGLGSRFLPQTRNHPKPLVPLIDGTTLLQRQVEGAISAGYFNKIIVVTGYKCEQIDHFAKQYTNQIDITTSFNPFYEIANNIVSLWSVREELVDGDFMISNGDNAYHPNIWSRLNIVGPGIWLTVSYKSKFDDDDMKVTYSRDYIKHVSKNIDRENIDAESVGLMVIKGLQYRPAFIDSILECVHYPERLQDFFVWLPNYMPNQVKPIEIGSKEWFEVDYPIDVENLPF